MVIRFQSDLRERGARSRRSAAMFTPLGTQPRSALLLPDTPDGFSLHGDGVTANKLVGREFRELYANGVRTGRLILVGEIEVASDKMDEAKFLKR